MNKKIILLAAAGGLLFFYMKKDDAICPGPNYLVEGKKVCENDLANKGYYYWGKVAGETGSGYYNLKDFNDPFGFPIEDFNKTIIGLLNDTVFVNSNYSNAQSALTSFSKPGITPLVEVV